MLDAIVVNLISVNSGEDKNRNFAEPETNSNAPNFGTVESAILSSFFHQKSSKSFIKRLFLEGLE